MFTTAHVKHEERSALMERAYYEVLRPFYCLYLGPDMLLIQKGLPWGLRFYILYCHVKIFRLGVSL